MNTAKTFLWILLLNLGFAGPAGAAERSQDEIGLTPTASQILGLETVQIEAGRRLRIENDVHVQVFAGLNGGDAKIREVLLRRSYEIEILEVSADGRIAHVGIDTDQPFYSDLYISVDDLKRANLAIVPTDSFDEDLEPSITDGTSIFRRRGGGGMTYCYRDVKNTLLRVKICSRYPSGSMASQGYSILANECGMRKLGDVDHSRLPAYSVCVSGGGRISGCGAGGCGHIAVKLPNGMWYGAGTRNSPYLPDGGKGYKKRYRIGCLAPR